MIVACRKRGREKLLVSQKIYISENWNGKCEHRLVERAIARFHHATHIVSNVALVSYNKFPDQHPFMKMGFSVYEKKKGKHDIELHQSGLAHLQNRQHITVV